MQREHSPQSSWGAHCSAQSLVLDPGLQNQKGIPSYLFGPSSLKCLLPVSPRLYFTPMRKQDTRLGLSLSGTWVALPVSSCVLRAVISHLRTCLHILKWGQYHKLQEIRVMS